MWQNQLNIIWNVFPIIILPDSLIDVSCEVTLHDLVEQMQLSAQYHGQAPRCNRGELVHKIEST